MQKSTINVQNGILPPVDTAWLQRCILPALEAHSGESLSLKRLAFARLIKDLLTTKGSLADLDTLHVPKEAAAYIRRELNRIFAVEWLRSCGKLYTPYSHKLSRPFTMMSSDRSYFFEYDDISTIVYKMDDIYPIKILDIEGKLLAISLDSKYLLLKRQHGLIFYDLQRERICCSYDGPYQTNRDFLLFDPTAAQCSPLSSIAYNTIPLTTFRNHYTISNQEQVNELLSHEDTYIFTIEGHGLPIRCLSYGQYLEEAQAVVLPKCFWFSRNHGIAALFLYIISSWQEANTLYVEGKAIPLHKEGRTSIYAFDFTQDIHRLALGGQESFLMSCPVTDATTEIDLRDPRHTHLKMNAEKPRKFGPPDCFTYESESTDDNILRLAISPNGDYILSIADWEEYMEGHAVSATVRLHSVASHDLHEQYNHNYALLDNDACIQQFGFNKDGSKFFICTKTHFQIFDLTSFTPTLSYAQWEQVLSLLHSYEYAFLEFENKFVQSAVLAFIMSLSNTRLQETLISYVKLSDFEEPIREAEETIIMLIPSFALQIKKAQELEKQQKQLGKWSRIYDLLRQTHTPMISKTDIYRALGFSGIPQPDQVLDSRLLNDPNIAPYDVKTVSERLQLAFHTDTISRCFFDQEKAPREYLMAQQKATVVTQLINDAREKLGIQC